MAGQISQMKLRNTTYACGFLPLLILLMLSQPLNGFVFQSQSCSPTTFYSPIQMIRESDKFGPADGIPPSADSLGPEVITPSDDGDDEYGDADEDWIPDIEKARIVEEWNLARAEEMADRKIDSSAPISPPESMTQEQSSSSRSRSSLGDEDGTANVEDYFTPTPLQKSRRQIYTDEEEELINQMGGNSMDKPSPKREPGFLGDSTLKEIASDFQIPICYLADVLCTWGVPVPINVDDRLGDMVTGEMAFSMAEAVHTLDVGELSDSYSNFDLTGLCYEFSIELKDAFDFCIKEGWNLPFGVRTHLRVDQEDKLLQALSDDFIY